MQYPGQQLQQYPANQYLPAPQGLYGVQTGAGQYSDQGEAGDSVRQGGGRGVQGQGQGRKRERKKKKGAGRKGGSITPSAPLSK